MNMNKNELFIIIQTMWEDSLRKCICKCNMSVIVLLLLKLRRILDEIISD